MQPIDPADPRADFRLRPLLERVERRQVDVLSFDFFDTLCGRAVPEPVNAFPLVGRALLERGLLPKWFSPGAFFHVRQLAERRARELPGAMRPECLLSEIYGCMPPHLIDPARCEEAVAVEVECEASLAIIDPALLNLAARARDLGIKVAVVSDTYFSAAHLRVLLDRGGGAEFRPDLLLTSSDRGRCKGAGLFKDLLRDLQVAPGRVAHLGDNHDADVVASEREGIQGFHFPASDAELRKVWSRERALESVAQTHAAGFAYLRNRALWRAQAMPQGLDTYFRLGATVFGPVFAAFAEWVADQMEAQQAQEAVCFMREGDFLAELVGRALRARHNDAACKPIWISREAAFRASLGPVDEAELREALVRRSPPSVARYCESLGVTANQVGLDPACWNKKMDQPQVHALVFRTLLAPENQAKVRAAAALQRDLLIRHLRQLAPGKGPLACIDLGWGGTIQKYFHRALTRAEASRPLIGLYLALTPRAADLFLEGSTAFGFLTDLGARDRWAEIIVRSPEMFEQLCLSPTGSVKGYRTGPEEAVVPVQDAREPDPQGDRTRAAVREGILYFQHQWQVMGQSHRRDRGALHEVAAQITVRLIARPLTSEAALLGSWRHDDNFGSPEGGLIAPMEAGSRIPGRPFSHVYWDPQLYWPAGVAARVGSPAAEQLAGFALLNLFDDGAASGRSSDVPAHFRAVDRLNELMKQYAPSLHARTKASLLQQAAGNGVPQNELPLRHRTADGLNQAFRRLLKR